MMKRTFAQLAGAAILCVSGSVSATNPIPDFYQEPGVNPYRDYAVDPQGKDFIDPFSGVLRRHYVDLAVPGAGGLDIVVNRVYHPIVKLPGVVGDPYLPGRTITGIGWDIHFARVRSLHFLFSPAGNTSDCRIDHPTSEQNPVLELPDGTRKVLFNRRSDQPAPGPDEAYYDFITKDRWIARCLPGDIDNGRGFNGGVEVKSPDGTTYTLDWRGKVRTSTGPNDTEYVWLVTRIEDRNGNWLQFHYRDPATTVFTILDGITASDGRVVSFGYTDVESLGTLLTSIEHAGRIWYYDYVALEGPATPYFFLDRVRGPEGLVWDYDYYRDGDVPPDGALVGPGLYNLKEVVGPYGAVTTYTYQKVDLGPYQTITSYTTAVQAKSVSAEASSGEWSYRFYTVEESDLDFTEVTTPSRIEVYEHCGARAVAVGMSADCNANPGKLLRKRIFGSGEAPSGGTPIQEEIYRWGPQLVTDQVEKFPARTWSIVDGTIAGILLQKTVARGGGSYTTEYYNFDPYGNPELKVEYPRAADPYGTSDLTDPATRITLLAYHIDTAKWIVQTKDEQVLGVRYCYSPTPGSQICKDASGIVREFDGNGNLWRLLDNDKQTLFTYHASGDVHTRTDARDKVTTYEDYMLGVARTERHPEGVTRTREVNSTGTVASETNGRGYTTGYEYDGLNRLVGITTARPDDADVLIEWTWATRVLRRGGFEQTHTFDALGRVAETVSDGIVQTFVYDAEGRRTFASDPGSAQGTAYIYDALGRITKLTHTADATSVLYDYSIGPNQVAVTNERDYTTTYTYRSYGDPDERYVVEIDAPESVVTSIGRSKIGEVLSITQGGLTRSYQLDANRFRTLASEPETGVTRFAHDGVGNLTRRSANACFSSDPCAGQRDTLYEYDGLNRLRLSDYPTGTPDITYEYDDNGNLELLTRGDTQWAYAYDENDNLTGETLRVGGESYTLIYGYDARDALETITYPSGLVVDYAPNLRGWPTSAAPFLAATPTGGAAVTYYPGGQIHTLRYANGHTTTFELTPRLFTRSIQAPGVVDLSYVYDDVGNPNTITDHRESLYSRALDYDGLDRLTSAAGSWGAGTLVYDTTGNIDTQEIGATFLDYHYTDNRLTSITGDASYSFAYDVYGNVRADGQRSFEYNEAFELTDSPEAGMHYTYDGNRRRVLESDDAASRLMLYNRAGRLMYEKDLLFGDVTEYVYLGSQLVARRDDAIDCAADADGDGIPNCEEILMGFDPYDPTDGNADPDADGLTNAQEYQAGTDMQSADTDADGMPDGFEVGATLNPLVDDAAGDLDGDGFTNLAEYHNGTDPAVPDPLLPVAGVVAVPGDGDNAISWLVEDESYVYNLYWSTAPGVSKSTGHVVPDVSSPYVHAALTNGTPYYYVVTARNIFGESAESTEVSAVPNTRSWSVPLVVAPSERGDVAIDGRGSALVTWYEDGPTPGVWVRALDLGGHLSDERLLSGNGRAPKAAANVHGEADVIWLASDGFRTNLWGSQYTPNDQSWSTPRMIERGYSRHSQIDPSVFGHQIVTSDSGFSAALWIQPYFRTYPGTNFGPASKIVNAKVNYPATGVWSSTAFIDASGVGWSYDPRLSIDPNGHVVAVWDRTIRDCDTCIFYEHILSSRFEPGSGWSGPWQVDDTDGSPYLKESQVAMDGAGNALTVWLQRGRSWDLVGNHYDVAQGWGARPEGVDRSGDLVYSPVLSRSRSGSGLSLWRQGGSIWFNRYDPAGGWERAATLGSGDSPSVGVADDGSGVALWRGPDGSLDDLYAAQFDPVAGWTAAMALDDHDSPVTEPKVVVDRFGNAAALWVQDASLWMSLYAVEQHDANLAPIADAGLGQSVDEEAAFTLDASASNDPDGTVTGYLWTQLAGPAAALADRRAPTPSLTAPTVHTDTLLTFELQVTDDQGRTGRDSVNVTVRDVFDTEPPTTTASVVKGSSQGTKYFDITTTTDEPATTYFRVMGNGRVVSGGAPTTDWQQYAGPIRVEPIYKNGTATFQYYSVDTAGNQESTKSERLDP